MDRCDKLVDVGRRQFLRGAGMATVGAEVTETVGHYRSDQWFTFLGGHAGCNEHNRE